LSKKARAAPWKAYEEARAAAWKAYEEATAAIQEEVAA